MKTAFDGLISRFDTTKERICEYEEYSLLPKKNFQNKWQNYNNVFLVFFPVSSSLKPWTFLSDDKVNGSLVMLMR